MREIKLEKTINLEKYMPEMMISRNGSLGCER